MSIRAASLVRVAMALSVMCAVAWPQANDDSATRSRVLALEHAWNQAEGFKDLKALDALFDNDMVYVDSDGSLMTKAALLAHVKTAHLQQVVTDLMTVQIFDKTAIVTGAYRSSELKNGKPIQRRGRFIDTWVFKNSTWVCVAAQATSLIQ